MQRGRSTETYDMMILPGGIMTRDDIMALSDEALRIKAAEMNGWTYIYTNYPGGTVGLSPDQHEACVGGWTDIPDYPHDIAAAWSLAKKIEAPFRIERSYRDEYGIGPNGWTVEIGYDYVDDKPEYEAWDKSVERAITRAFVIAMEGGAMTVSGGGLMTDNERIARWRGYRYVVPKNRQYDSQWEDGSGNAVSIVFDTDIALWHGEDGLLAEIERRGLSLSFMQAGDWLTAYGLDVDPWALLRATPAQLTAALVQVIELVK